MFLSRVDAATAQVTQVSTDVELGAGDVVGLDRSLWASDFINGRVVHLRIDAP